MQVLRYQKGTLGVANRRLPSYSYIVNQLIACLTARAALSAPLSSTIAPNILAGINKEVKLAVARHKK